MHHGLPIDVSNAADMHIGDRITYTKEQVLYNGKIITATSRYDYTVLPVISENSYIEKMPSIKEIGIKGKYYYEYIRGSMALIDWTAYLEER